MVITLNQAPVKAHQAPRNPHPHRAQINLHQANHPQFHQKLINQQTITKNQVMDYQKELRQE